MSATQSDNATLLQEQLAYLEQAASKLISMLADRAAYAKADEHEEIRKVIRALRAFCGTNH